MTETEKPSAAAMRAAEAIFRLETSANDPASAESVASIIDAEFAPLVEALKALPLEAFDKPMDDIDAAEFVDNAGAFFEAMRLAREAIAKAEGRREA